MSVSIKRTRGGLDALAKALREQVESGKHLQVGFLEGATYPDGTPVAEVAFKNEFGDVRREGGRVITTPSRPFMRTTIARHSGEWGNNFGRIYGKNHDIGKSLAIMGEGIVGQIQRMIIEWKTPPNSKETVERKGFNNPLVDTRTMLHAVSSHVKDGKDD